MPPIDMRNNASHSLRVRVKRSSVLRMRQKAEGIAPLDYRQHIELATRSGEIGDRRVPGLVGRNGPTLPFGVHDEPG